MFWLIVALVYAVLLANAAWSGPKPDRPKDPTER